MIYKEVKVNPGQLRFTITIQELQTFEDEGGGKPRKWVDVYTDVPAHIEPIRGNRELLMMSPELVVTHMVCFRFIEGVNLVKHRFIYNGDRVLLPVEQINVDELDWKQVFTCREEKIKDNTPVASGVSP